jgi:chitinase
MVKTGLALVLLSLGLVNATQVMHRPTDFKSHLRPNAPFSLNHTASERVELTKRATGKTNVGYFTNWGIYGRNFQPNQIPADKLTHILYSFADVNSAGQVVLTDTYADQQKHYDGDSWSETGNNVYGCFKQLYLLKKQHRNLKVLLSIGGWTYSQSGHFNFVTNSGARASFVSSAIQIMEDNGLDGIDIDFEYPTAGAQAQGFASLLSELRTGLNNWASKKGESNPYQLTVAVPAGKSNYQNLLVSSMNPSLTMWNLMAYDYAGSWSTVSDDQSNLYMTSQQSATDTDSAVKWYIANGATANKINLGIPLYGRAFESTNGIRQSFSGIGPGTWEAGVYDYKALPFAGAKVTEDTAAGASYSYDSAKKELVSYDTPNIVNQKAQYIQSKGLSGAMFWELSSDKTGVDSLVGKTSGVFGGLDQTQNHLSYPFSQFDNMKNGMGSGPITTTPPTSTTTSNPPTSTPPTGGCNGVAAWSSGTVYVGGQTTVYNNHIWKASWWTQGDVPGGAAGVWVDQGAC